MTYKVKYESNYDEENINTYSSKEEAEKSIQEELDDIISEYEDEYGDDYDYGTGGGETEIFALGGDRYDRWIRMWEREE